MKKLFTIIVCSLFLFTVKGQSYTGSFTPSGMPLTPGTTITVTFTSTGTLTPGLKIWINNPPAANAMLTTTEVFGGYAYSTNFTIPAGQPSPSNIFFIIGNTAGTAFYGSLGTVSVLPINFVSNSIRLDADKVTLNWKVASLDDAKEFNVLRSTNGINYIKIATVKPGSSTDFKYEDFLSAIDKGTFYYKISGVSQNGAIKETNTMVVRKGFATDNPVILNNSNVKNELLVTGVNLMNYKNGEVRILDVMGRNYAATIQNSNSISVNSLAAGMYFLKIKDLPALGFIER